MEPATTPTTSSNRTTTKGQIDAILNDLLDGAMLQSKAMTIACMKALMFNNLLGDRIMERLQHDLKAAQDRLEDPLGVDADTDVAREWLIYLSGLESGYEDML